MKFLTSFAALLFATATQAAINGKCTASGIPGVCITTASCSSGGGKSNPGFCPDDPTNVQCCTKACGSGGTCKWTDQCTGTSTPGLCPGPKNFQCCTSKDGGGGGGSTPKIPTANCKAHVVASGKKILAEFPGHVHTVWCYAKKPGDHGTGLALDLMVKNRAAIGRTMAEWVMNNHKSLRVKYVIWGQKIWNVESDSTKPWTDWEKMEDRGDDTKNHWDHNHVSFLA